MLRTVHRAGKKNRSKLCGKVALLVSEDWFVLSHFRPLIAVLTELADSLVVVTRCSGHLGEIEALGARVINFDFRRSSSNPAREALLVPSLAKILRAENPDVIHMVAMKPIVLGGFAAKLTPIPHMVVHVTGLGLMGVTQNGLLRLYRAVVLRHVALMTRKPSSLLFVENSDDLARLHNAREHHGLRYAVLGGAGVDPEEYPALSPPRNAVPVAAYVGRLIKSKGVDLLMQAYDLLLARGHRLQLGLFGRSDDGNKEAVGSETIKTWCAQSGACWHGHVKNIVDVWRHSDFLVLPSRGGEGMPRALLEAAACARPLVVTDVPGNRQFVRSGIEGLVVPPQDVGALACALERMATEHKSRERMGAAARMRLLDGYTEAHVKRAYLTGYESMLRARAA
jgi:glycosyltransferase involved in cell wall biosynthesis